MLADKNFRQWSSNRENYFSRNSPVHSAFIIIHPAPKPFPPTPFFAARDSHTSSVGRCFATVLFVRIIRFKPIVQLSIRSIHFLLNLLQAVRTSSCISEGMSTLQVLQTMEWPCRGGLESTPKTRWALGVFSTILQLSRTKRIANKHIRKIPTVERFANFFVRENF